jgi:phospholipid/cholesterol/gamma-HCH transport system substrate-binding protein
MTKMETNVNYTIVGVFVISLMAVTIFTIIWLSSGFSSNVTKMYKVYMTESVSGLNIDSPVEYNGVSVGAVKSIELNQKNPQLVEVLLSIKQNTPITEGTVATLNVKGLTGIAYIALQDKGLSTTPLVALEGQDYPIIKTAPSFFLRLDTAITKLNENLHSVSTSIRMLLDQENLRSFKEILINIRQLTGSLAANGKEFTTIMQNTAAASRQFGPLMQSSSDAIQVFTSQTLPAANRAAGNFATIGSNLSAASQEIKQNPAVLIRGRNPRALGPGE